jgi:hypothetical protein
MNREKWLESYRTDKQAIWIKCKLSDGQEFFLKDFDGWQDVKSICENEILFPTELSLQFRSHEVSIDLAGAEAVYMAKSVKGSIGGKTTKFYVTGVLIDGIVYKKWWQVPELVVERTVEDDLSQCFEETLIYDKTRENRKEQV